MYVTEQEARQKRCLLGPHSAHCIGSACMAWRWGPKPLPAVQSYTDADRWERVKEPARPVGLPATWEWRPADGDAGYWREPKGESLARRCGWCGRAGKPEER